jgi:hypothetical protein
MLQICCTVFFIPFECINTWSTSPARRHRACTTKTTETLMCDRWLCGTRCHRCHQVSACVRALCVCSTAYFSLRRHFEGQAEDDTSAARDALREDLTALCGGAQVCAQFGTPLVMTAKSCNSLSVNRVDSSRQDYFFDNVEVTLPPPHSLGPNIT